MMTDRCILLVSPDLMVASQLAGLAASAGFRLETLRDLATEPAGGPWRLVLVDLQAFRQDGAEIVGRVRTLVERGRTAAQGPVPLVAFGPHVDRERLAAARSAGADEAVSRGEVVGGFAALVARWCVGAAQADSAPGSSITTSSSSVPSTSRRSTR